MKGYDRADGCFTIFFMAVALTYGLLALLGLIAWLLGGDTQ